LAIHGHRGMKNDPLYSARRTLHTGAGLLTDKQAARLTALFADDAHVEVEATWGIYQRMIAAYRHEDRRRGRELMVKLIDTVSTDVPNALVEVTTLGRTLKKRAADVLAYFGVPAPATAPPRRSTAGSSTCAVPHSGSATSRTTSPDRCSRPEASGRNYTLDREEPDVHPSTRQRIKALVGGPAQEDSQVRLGVPTGPPDSDPGRRTSPPVEQCDQTTQHQNRIQQRRPYITVHHGRAELQHAGSGR
jgi:hypothetical protein